MSKRGADTQLTKDTMADGEGTYGGGQPQRATAAQMAARNELFRALLDQSNRVWWDPANNSYVRLAKPRGARRPGTARPSLGLGASSSALRQQQALPAFGQSNGSQQGGLMFGQQPNGDTRHQTSASFPPSVGSLNKSNGGFNKPFTAPSGAFSFNAPPVNNPFSSTATGSQSTPQANGFQGSLFNVQMPSKNNQEATGESKPSSAPGAPGFSSQANGAAQNQTQPSTNGFTWPPSQQQQSQTNSNLFQQSSSTQQQQSTTFGQNNNKPKVPTTGIFANLQSPPVQEPEDKSKQPTSDIFAHPKTPEAKPAENPFAASIAKFQKDQKNKSATTTLGNSNQQLPQSSSSLFGATAPTSPQTQSDPTFSSTGDSMQTSPDNTPQKEPQTQSTPFSSMNHSSSQQQMSPTKTSVAQPTGGSLFDRITKPPSENPSGAPASPISSDRPTVRGHADIVSKPQGDSNDTAGSSSSPVSGVTLSEVTEQTSQPVSSSSDNIQLFGPSETATSPKQPRYVTPGGMLSVADLKGFPKSFENIDQAKADADYEAFFESHTNRNISASASDYGPGSPPRAPSYFTSEEQRQLVVGYRLKQLDIGMYKYVKSNPGKNTGLLMQFYSQKKQAILAAGDGPVESSFGNKRKASSENHADTSQAKKQKNYAFSNTGGPTPWDKTSAESNHTVTQNKSNGPLQPLTDTNTKRKAEEDLVRDDSSIISGQVKRARTPGSTPQSHTSSLFSNILDPNRITSPTEKPQGTTDDTTSSVNMFRLKAPATNTSVSAGNSNGAPWHSLLQPEAISTSSSTVTTSTSPVRSTTAASESSSTLTAPPFKPLFSNTPPAVSSAPKLFSIKPTTAEAFTASTPAAGAVPSLKLPTFGSGAPANFLSQFGDAAKKSEEEAKKKRKAEDYDSEEEDEATWEQRDAEEQQKKRQKIEQAAKAAQKFVPQIGLKKTGSDTDAASTQKSPVKSVFDQIHPAFGKSETHHNIFGHLAKQDSDADADKNTEAGGEDDGDDDAEENVPNIVATSNPSGKASNAAQPLGRSLFDRASKADERRASATDAPSSEGNQTGDHTWKVNSPIKFGANTSSPPAPAVNVISASPSKIPFGGLFGASKFMPSPEIPTKPDGSIFSNIESTSPGANVGFAFSPAKPATNALAPPSNNTSRATSPGATTGESANESAVEGPDDTAGKQEQLDLMSERAGEENEDVLFEVKAKGLCFDAETKQWISKGVGPLRVLKHRQTGKPRIVLRAEPSGRVVINSGFVKEGKYENIGCKTVAAPIIADGKLGPWRLRVGNDIDLQKLWETLDENKILA
ncbi:MAG: hypothetical protein Q9217_005120 [Psora testacea]